MSEDQRTNEVEVHEEIQEKSMISRRKLLASLGMAGAALATSVIANGSVMKAFADPSNDSTNVENLMDLNVAVTTTIVQLRANTEPVAEALYFVKDFGKEGVFYYDSSDTASPDNLGTVIVSTSGARFKRIIDDHLNPKWFGAVGDSVIDDTEAFRQTVLGCISTGIRTISVPTANYKILGTILIPANMEVNLNWSVFEGGGSGTNNIFESAYVDGNLNVLSNVGIPGDHQPYRVIQTTIRNGTIRNCNKAFNLWNLNEACEISGIHFWNCTWAIYAERCWYASFYNMMSRGDAAGATNAAYYFNAFVNVQRIESLFVVGRELGFELSGGADGLMIHNCAAEGCSNGLKVTGECNVLTIDTCYFEGITGTAIDLGTYAKRGVRIDNNWFYETNVACKGSAITNGYFGGNNRLAKGNCIVDFSENTTNQMTVEISQLYSMLPTNQQPAIPSNYLLGSKTETQFIQYVNDNNTGHALTKAEVHNGLIPFLYSGDSGASFGTVPFCTVGKSGGTTFTVYIDTKIAFRNHTSLVAFNLKIDDNQGSYKFYGIVFGDIVQNFSASGKTISAVNQNGYLRIAISNFYHPSSSFGCEGVVRIV